MQIASECPPVLLTGNIVTRADKAEGVGDPSRLSQILIVFALSTARSGSNNSEKYSCAACLRSSSVANSLLIPASSPASSQKPAHLGHSSTSTPRLTL